MPIDNKTAITIIVTISIIILVLLTVKNYRDRKKVLPPDVTDDTVSESKMDKSRRRDKL